MAAPNSAVSKAENELVLTRVFDAPRELVFKMWVEPQHLEQWWGPHGFTNPVCEADARPGGAIRIDMRGPDGTVYPMTGIYQEIVKPERIVFLTAALDEKGEPMFEILNTVTLTEHNGRTTQTLQARVVKATDKAPQYLAGMELGWTQSLERLAGHVAETYSTVESDREIVVSRVINAPRELVFDAWTDAKHVSQWWGPRGFTTTTYSMDLRPGGIWRFVMHGPDGRDYKNKITYLEVVRPERLVYKHAGEEEHENVKFQAIITFVAQGKKTRITLRSIFESAAGRDEAVQKYGAVEGGKQTLARLAEQVESHSSLTKPI